MTQQVSIIVPCYNGERFVDQCLESIYTQDYPCVELIIVDDGSTDHSHERIIAWNTRFKEKGYELKYVFQQNQGLGGAINTGLKFVTGDYLTLLDVDDIFLNGSISERARFLAAHPDYNAVRTNGWIIKGETEDCSYRMMKKKSLMFLLHWFMVKPTTGRVVIWFARIYSFLFILTVKCISLALDRIFKFFCPLHIMQSADLLINH